MKSGLLLFLAAAGSSLFAQTWDTTGNQLLQGTYYFRQVAWVVGDNSGTLGQAISLYGTVAFDGNGNYTMNASAFDSGGNGSVQNNIVLNGTYSIAASGNGFLSNPLVTNGFVYGLVSGGIFVASSTEDGFNDLFIAAQLASPQPGNSFFKGSYSMVGLDFPDGVPTSTRDSQFQLNPDGNGNVGSVRATGYIAGAGSGTITQNIGNVRYFFSNGAANINFGGSLTNSNLIAGTKFLYFSADGNFVFGGSPTAWDMIIGVRNNGGAPNFNGLYYQAGVFQDESQLASGFADLDTFYGSLKSTGTGVLYNAQRFLSVFNNNTIDFGTGGSYSLNSDGTYDDSVNHFIFGNGGALRIGVGKPPLAGVNVAVLAPNFNQSSPVYINPTGVANAGSFAPFTMRVAPGELISIFGANLAPSLKVDGTFPFTLNGVQVMINNRPAPIYFVSSGQVSAVVPFGTTELIADIQVINNGVASNTVSSFVNLTEPGIFTEPVGGLGSAKVLHPDFTQVTPNSPAQVGETIAIYLTGLGDVNPAVADGTPGPSNPTSVATNAFNVFIDGQQSVPAFAGLAPGLVGLYQINVAVPSGVHSGNVALEIQGPDCDTSEATLPVVGVINAPAVTSPLAKPGRSASPRLRPRIRQLRVPVSN